MVRKVNRLSAVTVKASKKPGRYADGDGLYLYVSSSGNRSWVFRYRDRVSGKLRDKGLGPERDVTLMRAREAAAGCRDTLRGGGDPIDGQRLKRQADRLERSRQVTFGDCVAKYVSAHEKGWRNVKHAAQWTATLDTYASTLSALPVSAIDIGHVLACVEPIWADKTETATRVRQRIEAVLDWATVRKYRAGDNPARWRGHLQKLLPAPAKLKNVKRRAALPYVKLPALMAELVEVGTSASLALRLQILTATRPSESTSACWSEFDLSAKTWTVPADRMKAAKEHRIPLTPVLIEMLESMPRSSRFLFPGKPDRPITTAATLKLLQTIYPELTAHGFRSTFRDWAAEQTAYPGEVIEAALAHSIKDKTEAAYRRTDLFDRRAKLMADWERFCNTTATNADITPIRKNPGTTISASGSRA